MGDSSASAKTTEASGTDPSSPNKADITVPVSNFSGANSDPNLDEQQKKKAAPLPFLKLFAYANRGELALLIFSFICASIHGTLMPLFTIIFGAVVDEFAGASLSEEVQDRIVDLIGSKAKWFLIFGGIAFVSATLQVRYSLLFAQNVSTRLRILYFTSLMKQDYTWYDGVQTGELTSRVAEDVNLIEAGIGEKIASSIQFLVSFIVGIIIAFVYGWKLTLVVLGAAPFLMLSGAFFAKLAAEGTSTTQDAYSGAGGIATEVFSLIKTVKAFNGQKAECKRYDEKLQQAHVASVRKSILSGLAMGSTYFIIFCTFAAAFAFGGFLVRRGEMNPGDIIVTFFSVFIATMSLGQSAPGITAISTARGAAPKVYEVIERESEIDPLNDEEGIIPDNLVGDIHFNDIKFNYPNRRTEEEESNTRVYVLDNFQLRINNGESHALVGPSGCGKSTTVRLIERYYDVEHGNVLIDGKDIREYNVRWLRNQIGYVGQMPTLFMLSIKDNIKLGAPTEIVKVEDKNGSMVTKAVRKELSDEEIIEAAKMANAHDFIMKLPEQYNTLLGERGALLSGGQKQRICIARAIVRNPKILLLDESTSALDSESERHVQDALEVASRGRTTIIIAHRLSTVKNCNVISVINNGKVIEEGTHENLLNKNGAYKTLVENQNISAKKIEQGSQSTNEQDTSIGSPGANISSVGEDKSSATKGNTLNFKVAEEDEEEKEKEASIDPGVVMRAFVLNKGEWPFIILGMLGSALSGAAFPLMALAFANVLGDLPRPDNESAVRRSAILFVLIGCGSLVGNILQFGMLGVSGSKLTKKLRSSAFKTLLKQELGYFDRKENSVGQVTTRLATEATLVQGLTGSTLGSATYVFSAILTGMIIAFSSCWEVALVILAIFPLMAFVESINVKMLAGFDANSSTKFGAAGAIASESLDNYDTVTSLGIQDYFIGRYEKELEGPLKDGRKSSIISGLSFGFAEFLMQTIWAVAFWIGSVFIRMDRCDFTALMKGISGLLFAGSSLGQTAQFMPDFPKSRVAATRIFRLLDRNPEIQDPEHGGKQKDHNEVKGEIKLKGIHFEYPTRPDVPVLRGLSLNGKQGQLIALVGASGCGKSSTVSLIERFYDVRAGSVDVDDIDVRDWKVNNVRSHLGIVSQEPDLFNRSVRDNIAYGLMGDEDDDDMQVITDDMVREAAEQANAHDFIMELDEGYNTIVGARGEKLSGGQRQRVAISRSLIRKPKILLLDEATSALDSTSERNVQKALERASGGRTTVAIAHRLSTIKDADVICVLDKGRVVEKGKHYDLMRKNGVYASLVKNQVDEVA